MEPLVFDLLRLFVENVGVVIDRDRMCAEVWGGRVVSDATLSTAVKSARRALGDSGVEQSFIETVRGRGFRFRAEVEIERGAEPLPTGAGPGPAGRGRRRAGGGGAVDRGAAVRPARCAGALRRDGGRNPP